MKYVWTPLPDYVGVYWICPEGYVRNARGTVLKNRDGVVELRKNGMRERFEMERLLQQVFGGNKHEC